jgi:hypothetical protein
MDRTLRFWLCAITLTLLLYPGVAVPAPGQQGKAANDLQGDPLPNHALARLGSLRFRHAGLTGKRLVHV